MKSKRPFNIRTGAFTRGSIEWYDAQCDKHVYNTGDCWTENTAVHDVRTAVTTNARFMITYGIAKGQPRRIDEPRSRLRCGTRPRVIRRTPEIENGRAAMIKN